MASALGRQVSAPTRPLKADNVHAFALPTRILILTGAHLCRNPRVVKEATTLGDAGYDVTVLGVRSHRPSVVLDEALVAGAPYAYRQIELIRGTGAWFRRAKTRIGRELAQRCGAQLPGALGPAAALLHAARRHRADLVICHTEAALWAGSRLLDQGHRVAADFEDWHSEDLLPSDRRSRPLHLLRTVERNLIRQASYTTTTSEALAAALHDRYGGRAPAVITNAFPLQPDPLHASARGVRPDNLPTLCWFSQTTGPGRGLEPFLSAWQRTTVPSRLVLLGEGSAEFRQRMLLSVPEVLRSRLSFEPPIPPAELSAWLARHDVGLALEQRSIPNRNLTITNKLLQYLNAGLAVLATSTAGQREVLTRHPEAGMLVDLDQPDDVAARLDALLGDPSDLLRSRRAARAAAEAEYCWEKQAPHLLKLVEQVIARAR